MKNNIYIPFMLPLLVLISCARSDNSEAENIIDSESYTSSILRGSSDTGSDYLDFSFELESANKTIETEVIFSPFSISSWKLLLGESLFGGKVVDDMSLWPASLKARLPNGMCSASLVGPRVLLTAAHCLNRGAQIRINIGNEKVYGMCKAHDEYDANTDHGIKFDYALCKMNESIEISKYETISLNKGRLKIGSEVLLSGFGCHDSTGYNDGKYRIGFASIILNRFTPDYEGFIRTFGDSVLCSGDSGGAVFYVENSHNKDIRKLIGVNVANQEKTKVMHSMFVATSSPTALEFFNSWLSNYSNLTICGINSNASTCR